MIAGSAPARLDLVLAGGGHAHITVLRSFGMRPEPGVRLTVIAKELDAPYSGMLPGLIAGHYTHADCHINLVRLARLAGARVIQGHVSGVDRQQRSVHIEGRPPLHYDLLSIDVGITPDISGIEGAEAHPLVVKPISELIPKWRSLEARTFRPDGPRRFVVIGGGAAGFELALALRHRFGATPGTFTFTLIAGNGLLVTVNSRAQRFARQSLADHGIRLIERDPAIRVTPEAVTLASGETVAADAVLIAAAAAPASWFAASGLPVDENGFLKVRPSLQLIDDDDTFAAGDCAVVEGFMREKAGVYAVRQGQPLADNLRLRARGTAARSFRLQRRHLVLLSTGEKYAIAAKGPVATRGSWVWRWKDRIDRKFVERFNEAPLMRPQGATAAADAEMPCAGCAAKVGPLTLARALGRFDPGHQPEDAAILGRTGKHLRLETVDFFRAFWQEPFVFGEIAAVHAMSDIYAMGGKPSHALATVVLPHASPRLMEEDLFQFLSGARKSFAREGVELAGGHSSKGSELAGGFAVSGTVAADRILRKGGARPGDLLILTKPVGTGILFAAEMRGLASAAGIAEALEGMRQSNGDAAGILAEHGASALTDVTGFGLAGHLLEMLAASGLPARIAVEHIPAYAGAWRLAEGGIASSLLAENLALGGQVRLSSGPNGPLLAMLFDPQTSGGLLASIGPEAAASCLAALRAGPAPCAAIIGEVEAAGEARVLSVTGEAVSSRIRQSA